MGSLLLDVRSALRLTTKSPAFTLIAVVTLAIGIAANTTVFSWIDNLLLKPLPGVDGRQLVAFETVAPNGEFLTTSYPDYRDYRDHLTLVQGLAVAQPRALTVGEEDHAEPVWGELVSGNYFDVLRVKAAAGRVFSPDEYGDKQGGYPVAVISHRLWQRRFRGVPGVCGTTIRVNRQQLTIVGIAPESFRGSIPGLWFDMWVPVMIGPQLNTMPDWMLRDRQTRNLISLARLNTGVTVRQAGDEAVAIALRLAAAHPDTNQGISVALMPIWKAHFGAQAIVLGPLRILMAVCVLVLLIACGNVANLLMARSTGRHKEFSIRMSLGAGRVRIARQLLTESLILCVLGAIAAVPLSLWMARALGYLMPPTGFPVSFDISISTDILVFTVVVCVAASILSGTAPALQTARADLNQGLKEGSRGGTAGIRSQRLRGWLVSSQVALALVAIVGAGLFARSFQLARRIHPGFDPQHVAAARLYLSGAGYSVPERKQFCERLRERMESQPGITIASYADTIPLTIGGAWEDLQIEGYVAAAGENMKIYRNVVAPGYFDLLRIPLLEGRDFNEQDDLNKQPVMIVTENFVRRFFHGGTAIGRRVHGWGQWFTVVGVAKDARYHRPNEPQQPYFYVPFRQVYRADLPIAVYVRSAADPNQTVSMLRREARAIDPNVSLFEALPLTEHVAASLYPQKVAATLLAVLGTIALCLTAVGLYGLMAFSVIQRTHEIGIRMALGARRADVLGLTIRQGMVLTIAGLTAGVLVSVAVTRLAAGLLVNVSPNDPVILAAAALFLVLVALIATYVPARRATRIDPSVALRCE